MSRSLRVAVPFPILAAHESGATLCLRERSVLLLVVAAFALGWIVSMIKDHYGK